LGKGLAKLLLIGVAVYLVIRDRLDEFPAYAFMPPRELMNELVELGWLLVLAATPIVFIIGAADYGYSTWRLTEQLKRTDQEVKDDNKQMEGDPQIKMQRRRMGRKMIVGGGLTEVRTADVVVTNPTHYAIALRYDRDRDVAPVVVAKGVDHLALKIRKEALLQGIARVEDRPLARALFAKVEMGHPVPENLYAQVARVLAIVHRRRQRSAARRV
jgi:flagellar biosynthetic protein FlhB